jgi:hypothetical protein
MAPRPSRPKEGARPSVAGGGSLADRSASDRLALFRICTRDSYGADGGYTFHARKASDNGKIFERCHASEGCQSRMVRSRGHWSPWGR